MSIQTELNDLYYQLAKAEAELRYAESVYYSCEANTPGRCSRESDRVANAKRWVARVSGQIGMLEYEAEDA